MLIRNGNVTEATHSNLLAVKSGTVYTHPDCNLILPGITKSAVLKICMDLSIPVIEQPIKYADIYNYDEWFITGTGSEVVPVVEINNKAIGNAIPGNITRKIQHEFFRRTYLELAGEEIRLNI
jgi:D-alanine transaminase